MVHEWSHCHSMAKLRLKETQMKEHTAPEQGRWSLLWQSTNAEHPRMSAGIVD